jgi:hypothetical protein
MKYNRLAYSGPAIEIENLDANMMKAFIVEMKQNVFNEKDPSKQCQQYPNAMFGTYDGCDDAYIKEKLADYFPSTFVPVWSTNNISLVTTHIHFEKNSINSTATKYWKYYLGNHVSECLLPCTETIFSASKVYTRKLNKDYSKIFIEFSQIVMISITDFSSRTFADFIANVGESLGLWLEVGAVQLLQLAVDFFLGKVN